MTSFCAASEAASRCRGNVTAGQTAKTAPMRTDAVSDDSVEIRLSTVTLKADHPLFDCLRNCVIVNDF